MSPWAVLASWKEPTGNNQVKEYVITGDITATVSTNLDKYMFIFKDTGITPGTNISATITAKYASPTPSISSYAQAYIEKPGMPPRVLNYFMSYFSHFD